MKTFSEWVEGFGDAPLAGDRYNDLPESSKTIIDTAIKRYIKQYISDEDENKLFHLKERAKYFEAEFAAANKEVLFLQERLKKYKNSMDAKDLDKTKEQYQ